MLVINHEDETRQFLGSFRYHADNWRDIEVIIIDNGSNPPLTLKGFENEIKIIRNEHNIGVPKGMQQAYENSIGDFLVIPHNDVIMHEQGWDTKLIQILEDASKVQKVGVAGFFGAKGIGTNKLYKEAYNMYQLVRHECVCSSPKVDKGHGHRPIRNGLWEQVAVLDGVCLIFNREFLDANNGLDLNLPVFHNYDQHSTLQAWNLGYQVITLQMDFDHISGLTNNLEKWEEGTGKTQAEIHYESGYPYFYNYWHPDNKKSGKNKIYLPYWVE